MRKFKSQFVKLLLGLFLIYSCLKYLSKSSVNTNDQQKKREIDHYENNHFIDLKQDEPIKINEDKNELDHFIEHNEPENLNAEKEINLKKDWHDYAQIDQESQRKGPGEQGQGFMLDPKDSNSNLKRTLYSHNGFNALVSDKISLERSLNDIRHPECKKKLYLSKLLKVSVIIPFHDEHLSVLLRSVYSIVKRTPVELLEEIILVDDFSKKEFLGKQLEDYVRENFKNGLVKIIRLGKREGLIRTRMAGARQAKGDIFVFFDSHIECTTNWLPPLIEPIVLNYTTVVCPLIDVINEETFAYTAQDNGARGVFDWDMLYKRIPIPDEHKRDPTEPFESPVMAGGLFAISKKWFFTFDGYDEGLDVWGGEQYELSFKVWQCGGRLVDAPCSRVAHIYRKFNPFGAFGAGDYISRNHKRVAETWMDEYKEYVYKRVPHMRNVDTGNLTKQIAIRQSLNCKSFKWFMENVAPDMANYYPPVPQPPYANGEIRSVDSNLCIDGKFKSQHSNFGLDVCQSSNKNIGGEQKFELTWRKDIRPTSRNVCWDVSRSDPGTPVLLFECHGMRGNQEFKYNPKTLQIFHPVSNQCLDSNKERKEIFMNPCDVKIQSQKWQFEFTNMTLIEKDFKF
ncbi:unnamed protein product [Brachionus calyciflorus]|uniref:Polypeptide N-acetylgalactosaminyltransferase n=1 Tax=Brachionus calyciflorus TaxID=104777 RepID=A0A813RYY1_9BILA|nr:unnamed protein product [Brachionus calyciflorus]